MMLFKRHCLKFYKNEGKVYLFEMSLTDFQRKMSIKNSNFNFVFHTLSQNVRDSITFETF